MRKKRSIKIMSVALIIVLVCISIIYFKNGSKEILATTKEYNSELEENEHMHLEEDANRDKVPVPNGYVGSKATGENEIDTGYVIYEGTEDVNNENVEEAQKTRNQYVWIPVPDASQMYGTDENGKKWGKLYEFTTDTGENIDPITGAKPLNWSESNGVIKIINKTGNREAGIIINRSTSAYDIDSRIKISELKAKTSHEFIIQLEREFNEMIESVEKYKGFYIGRYETGDLTKNEVVVKKGNIDVGSTTWYSMYKKCKKLNNENLNIETGIIWGSQWDRTVMWLVESKNKTKEDLLNSSNYGNFKDAEFKYEDENVIGGIATKKAMSSLKIPTGSTEYTKTNNIYDLAGNVHEWTMEAAATTGERTYRGGDYSNSGSDKYLVNRYYNIPEANLLRRLPSDVIYKIIKIIGNNFKKWNYYLVTF